MGTRLLRVIVVECTTGHIPIRVFFSLVVWFADGIYGDAAPPRRLWYRHKRGLAFIDVLRAAQRVLVGTDVLDPRSYSEDLQQSSALRPRSARSQLDTAA